MSIPRWKHRVITKFAAYMSKCSQREFDRLVNLWAARELQELVGIDEGGESG